MSMKSKNLAYFSDGHTEVITDFQISEDGHKIWFTVESGKWFVHKEELVCNSNRYLPDYKFYEVLYVKERDDRSEFGQSYKVKFIRTDEIEKIKICTVG